LTRLISLVIIIIDEDQINLEKATCRIGMECQMSKANDPLPKFYYKILRSVYM